MFDEPKTPLKFDTLRMLVSSARGSTIPLKSATATLAVPAAPAAPSPNGLAAQLHTPREFRPNRYARSETSNSPTTLVKDLESELRDLQSYTRLEKVMQSPASSTERIEVQVMRRSLADKDAELELLRAEHEELLMYRAGLHCVSDSEQSEDGTKL